MFARCLTSALICLATQMFKLALWSALVFFVHGSEMQVATALVINVLQLCVHVYLLPMGGVDAALLNCMQTCTLVLTTYLNFGALSLNYLEVSRTLAQFVDPGSVSDYDAPAAAIGFIMQLLTFGLILSFGGVAIKNGFAKARSFELPDSVSRQLSAMLSRFGSGSADETPRVDDGGKEERPASSVEMVAATNINPMNCWREATAEDGTAYYHNTVTGETSWTLPDLHEGP